MAMQIAPSTANAKSATPTSATASCDTIRHEAKLRRSW
jgi:hypothetical protein